MQASDLVIGKAGPNSVFEAVACLTPFFATTHIAGQEDGNLDIIRELKLGYVEEDSVKAAKLLHQIIENPKQLENFKENLNVLSDYNKQAKTKLKVLLDVV
jgi:UDP-N-acetylglucosamine:LPS N-acetylglucosamine transferase